ncbi:MAG: molybdenum cofactor biosynthesis protein MoaE, partial [Chromatiaceae bacterium]|nr:molybdenum cofactor biosynthesis protein MoaE [Chromatiaceae bacterium]
MSSTQIRIQATPFDPFAEQDELRRGQPQVGALVAFVGLMRDLNEGADIRAMTPEHYPGMTERALAAIADEARR